MACEREDTFQTLLRKVLNSKEYCILSGERGLFLRELLSDIDIIVNPRDLPSLERSLLGASGVHLVNLLQHESTCYYFILRVQDSSRGCFLPLDVGTDYRRDGRIWFSTRKLLQGRWEKKGFWVAGPEAEFSYLLVKKTLKGNLPPYAARRIQELAQYLGEKADVLAGQLFGLHWATQVMIWIREGQWEAFEEHMPILKRVLLRRKFLKDPLNPLRYWLPEFKRIWRRWQYPTGLFVAVLGPDGAGKSTLIQGLQKELAGAFRRTATFHLTPRLFRRGGDGGPVTDPHGKPPRSLPASLLKLAYYWLDYTLGYWLKVRPALVRSTFVLFDRYYDDLLVDPKRYRYGGPMWLARWLKKLIPKPDLFIVLDLSPDIAHKRKPELDVEELMQLRSEYLRLSCTMPNAYIVNASCEQATVIKNAGEIILTQMAVRTSRNWNASNLLVQKQLPSHTGILSDLIIDGDTPYRLIHSRHGAMWFLPEANRSAKNIPRLSSCSSLLHKMILKGWQMGFPVGKKVFLNRRVLAEITEAFGGHPDSVAIYIGTPGAYRKAVLVMCQNGDVSAVAKLSLVNEADIFVEWEASVINKINDVSPPFLVPKVLSTGRYAGRSYYVTTPLLGKRARPRLTKHHYNFCAWLYKLERVDQPFAECSLVKEWESSLELTDIGQRWPVIHWAVEWLIKRLSNKVLSFGWAHRDFAPWNMRCVENKLAVMDWELAKPYRPPAYDLFHFVSIQAAVKGRKPDIPWDSINNWVMEQAQDWQGLVNEIYCAYLIDQALYYAKARLETPDVGEEKVLNWILWQLNLIITGR